MKDCVKDRFDMVLVSTAFLKLRYNLIDSSQHARKQIHSLQNKHSSISFTFFHSLILNCYGLKAYQTYQTVYYDKGKTCFYSTNDNMLLLFFWRHKLWRYNYWQVLYFQLCLTFLRIKRKLHHFRPKFYLPLYWKLWSKVLY